MQGRLVRSALTSIGREAARIVLPSWCVACQRELEWKARIGSCCPSCWRACPRIDEAKCRTCATPWSGAAAGDPFVCIECSTDPPILEWLDAWGRYSGSLEKIVTALKFQRHDFLAEPLGDRLFELLFRRADFLFDTLVPVPLHPRGLRQRGYNQAERLARSLSRRSGIPCSTRLLRKRVQTARQSSLPRAERRRNVSQAFAATDVQGLSLLLVDDVCTTGETLRACAAELRRHGAERVCAVAIARA